MENLSIRQAAIRLGVCYRTARRMVKDGRLEVVHIHPKRCVVISNLDSVEIRGVGKPRKNG